MEKKLNSQRPGSSVRKYDDETSDLENSEKLSKLSKLPTRTYSLEVARNISSPVGSQKDFRHSVKKNDRIKHPQSASNADGRNVRRIKTKESPSQTLVKHCGLENKLEEDFVNFKQNILKIPEFWSDADQTVKNILKNAVNIVTKQYPTADVEAIDAEIQNIVKATEAVKQEILTKTEDIVNQANKIYGEEFDGFGPTDEELKLITEKMEELRNNVNWKNNGFGDLLKFGIDYGKSKLDEKLRESEKQSLPKDQADREKSAKTRKLQKVSGRRSKLKLRDETDEIIQSCGDILRQDAKTVIRLLNDSGTKQIKSHSCDPNITFINPSTKSFSVTKSPRDFRVEDKSCQTMSPWASEIVKREESLRVLNNKILELHTLCKDHISKFKSFNFQIKLRGMSNKGQSQVDAPGRVPSGKNKLTLHEYPTKQQRDVDVHQKTRLMNQQKKLLHVRDELIEMLKNRCNVEVQEI
ncbi:hypothetical protein RUM43_001636 [Polyplax serrata]|uniref:Uncharacterized protein n=1 Tax=Polyplax serrata TaxID=468196 RepID=A0AAN8SEN0_POLSC